jgi:response regulator RpfG family c-di-GMP phosphodiesterase
VLIDIVGDISAEFENFSSQESRILVVDDEEVIFSIIRDGISDASTDFVYAPDPAAAKDIIVSQNIDLVISDIIMPEETGIDLLRWCREKEYKIPFIVMTGFAEFDNVVDALNLGALSFVKKPFKMKYMKDIIDSAIAGKRYELMQKSFHDHLARNNNVLRQKVTDVLISHEQLFVGCLSAFAQAIDARDKYTQEHSSNVAKLAKILSSELNLSMEMQHAVETAGALHDIGKIGVPETILLKPGNLTTEEFSVMQKHPSISFSILNPVPGLEASIPAIKYHHERIDGRGYPDGLSGNDIPIEARVISVCDTWDAMRTDRPYRKALSKEFSLAELKKASGTQLCPEVIKCFIEVIENGVI